MVGAVRFELTLPIALFHSKTAISQEILGFLLNTKTPEVQQEERK
jgi:hypothetical protein